MSVNRRTSPDQMASVLYPSTHDRAGREGAHVAEMQRRRLLLAFSEVLAENGFEGAGVGRVCKRSRVSRRTFYDLFQDREACFLAAFEDAIQRISEGVLPVFQRGGNIQTPRRGGRAQGTGRWRERVRGALSVLLEFFDEQPAVARMCVVEAPKAGSGVLEYRRRVLRALAVAIDEGRAEARSSAGLASLTAEGIVGGAVSVIHERLLEEDHRPLTELLNPLMSMIVHPYLGPAAARRELKRPPPQAAVLCDNGHAPVGLQDPFKDLPIRITFRTARVLATIASQPGASNRQVADGAGISDQGQMSKLLSRLAGFGLIENHGPGHAKGESNAWQLTKRGNAIQLTINTPRT